MLPDSNKNEKNQSYLIFVFIFFSGVLILVLGIREVSNHNNSDKLLFPSLFSQRKFYTAFNKNITTAEKVLFWNKSGSEGNIEMIVNSNKHLLNHTLKHFDLIESKLDEKVFNKRRISRKARNLLKPLLDQGNLRYFKGKRSSYLFLLYYQEDKKYTIYFHNY